MKGMTQQPMVKMLQRIRKSLKTQDKALTTLVREAETMLLLSDKLLAAAKRAKSPVSLAKNRAGCRKR